MPKMARLWLNPDRFRGDDIFSDDQVEQIIQAVPLPDEVSYGQVQGTGDTRGMIKAYSKMIVDEALRRQQLSNQEEAAKRYDAELDELNKQLKSTLRKINKLDLDARKRLFIRTNSSLNNNGDFLDKMTLEFPEIKPNFVFSQSREENSDYYVFDAEEMLDDIKDKISFLTECLNFVYEDYIFFHGVENRQTKNNWVFDFIINQWCRVWRRDFCLEVGTSFNSIDNKSGGPLVRFISEFFRQLGYPHSDGAVRDGVRKMMEREKERALLRGRCE